MTRLARLALTLLIAASAPPALAQEDAAPRIAAQQEAMRKLAMLDGVWRGTAKHYGRGGVVEVTQTERVGPLLDGAIRVVEGRAYDSDGKTQFNAFGVISYDPATRAYSMHTNALGHTATVPLTPTPDGFRWELPRGPGVARYVATVKDGRWREVGDFELPGRAPIRIVEMELERIGDSDWPSEGAIPPS